MRSRLIRLRYYYLSAIVSNTLGSSSLDSSIIILVGSVVTSCWCGEGRYIHRYIHTTAAAVDGWMDGWMDGRIVSVVVALVCHALVSCCHCSRTPQVRTLLPCS